MREKMTQRELERLAVIAAKAAGLPARSVRSRVNLDYPGLTAVWIGDADLLECVDEEPLAGKQSRFWQVNSLNHYDHLREALAETVSAEAYERADAALGAAGVSEDA